MTTKQNRSKKRKELTELTGEADTETATQTAEQREGPPLLTEQDGAEVVRLLNELTTLMWPLASLADNVYLHYHADGYWRVKVGRRYGDTFDEWPCSGPSLVEALRAAIELYRKWEVKLYGGYFRCEALASGLVTTRFTPATGTSPHHDRDSHSGLPANGQ